MNVKTMLLVLVCLLAVGCDKSTDTLLEQLKDESAEVRSNAAKLLGRRREGKAVDPLIALVKDPSRRVGRAAIKALGAIGDERAVPALVDVLDGQDKFLPSDALEAMGNIGGAGIEALVKVMNDDSSTYQMMAVNALADTGDPRAIAAVTERAKGKSGLIRSCARSVLRDIKRRKAGERIPRRLPVKPIEWPEGAGYLSETPTRPSLRHDMKKTSSVAEIIAVDGRQFLFGNSSQIEYRESKSLFVFPGSQITYYADDSPKLILEDYNGDRCALIYGLTVAVDEFGQFVPLKYDPEDFLK